jgi:hypothetical protein
LQLSSLEVEVADLLRALCDLVVSMKEMPDEEEDGFKTMREPRVAMDSSASSPVMLLPL